MDEEFDKFAGRIFNTLLLKSTGKPNYRDIAKESLKATLDYAIERKKFLKKENKENNFNK